MVCIGLYIPDDLFLKDPKHSHIRQFTNTLINTSSIQPKGCIESFKIQAFIGKYESLSIIEKGSVNEQIAYALEKETWPRFYLPLAAA